MKKNITDRAKRYRARANAGEIQPRCCFFCLTTKGLDLDHILGDESDSEPDNLMWLCRRCNATKGYQQARNAIGVRTAQFNPENAPRGSVEKFRHAAGILLGRIKGDVGAAGRYIRNLGRDGRRRLIEKMRSKNPFKSEAQRRKFYAMAARGEISQATLRKWERETPPGMLLNPIALFPTRAEAQRFASKTPGSFITAAQSGGFAVLYDREARRNPVTYAQYGRAVAEHRRGAHDEGGAIIHATPKPLRSKYAAQIARTKKERRGTVPF